ncbi:hypothetical protein FRC01_008260 [Tulasnella sp. 417]|nr:hypothetical protein FRC01_008260 [Tulasnella sp. 417]
MSSGVESTDALPIDRLTTIEDELKAAKAVINQQLDRLIARILYRRKMATLVHELPPEVLVMIFGEFRPTRPGFANNTSLFDLLLVCRMWHDVIVGSPGLWKYFDARMPHKIAQLVINRSQTSPFSVRWHTFIINHGDIESKLLRMLDLLIENSKRVQMVDILASRWPRPRLLKLFSAPTPKLETLRAQVLQYDRDEDGHEPFDNIILSDGPPIKHLSLKSVGTQINSPRFSNLVTLELDHVGSSMLLQNLLPVLSSSRRLEKLHVTGYSTSDEDVAAKTPVTLPHLKELVLSVMRSRYAVALLASIYTPRCSHAEIHDIGVNPTDEEAVEALDAVVWRPGNDQATVILGGGDAKLRHSALKIGIQHAVVTIQSPPTEEPYCNLSFARVDVPRMFQRLVTILSQRNICPPLELQLNDGRIWRTNDLDLSFWGECVYSLVAEGEDACRSVIQLLSRRESVPGSDGMGWSFQNISKIVLAYRKDDAEDATLDADALLSLVQQRWSGQDGLAPATRPSHFGVSCSLTNFPLLANLEREFTRLMASFELKDVEAKWQRI